MKSIMTILLVFIKILVVCQETPMAKIIDNDHHYDIIGYYTAEELFENSIVKNNVNIFLTNENFNIYKKLYFNHDCPISQEDFEGWRKMHNDHKITLLYCLKLKKKDVIYHIVYYSMSNSYFTTKVPVMFKQDNGNIYLTSQFESETTFELKTSIALIHPMVFDDFRKNKSESKYVRYTSQISGVSIPFIDIRFIQSNYPNKYNTTNSDHLIWNSLYDQINKFTTIFSLPQSIDLDSFALSEADKIIVLNATKAGQLDVVNHIFKKYNDELKSIDLMNKLNDHFTQEIYKSSLK